MFPSDSQLLTFAVLAVIDLIFKGFALWKAAKNGQRNWFIILLLINTVGILPLIYMRYFQKKVK